MWHCSLLTADYMRRMGYCMYMGRHISLMGPCMPVKGPCMPLMESVVGDCVHQDCFHYEAHLCDFLMQDTFDTDQLHLLLLDVPEEDTNNPSLGNNL